MSPLPASLAAGFSGSLAAVASHCFDTAKTRSQCIVTPKVLDIIFTNQVLREGIFNSHGSKMEFI